MGTFNTKKILYASPAVIPAIADAICRDFQVDGFDVKMDSTLAGGVDVSISKGGTFKAVLGMRSALKITLTPQNGNISFEAGVGLFGQQIVPTIISMLFYWPVLVTQIWGLIRQANLDDKALGIAERVIEEQSAAKPDMSSEAHGKFCTECGARLSETSKFCSECGAKLV